MFGLTKNPPQVNNNLADPNQPTGFNIDEAPIHTMQDDLKNLKNPDAPHSPLPSIAKEKKPDEKEPLAMQRQSNSPFLNLADRNPLNGITAPEERNQSASSLKSSADKVSYQEDRNAPPYLKTQNISQPSRMDVPTNFKTTPSIAANQAVFHYNWRMIFFSTLSLFLILVLGWVGFQYSQDKNFNPFNFAKDTTTEPPPLAQTEQQTTPENPVPTPTLSYSETNPNYLRLENSDLDTEKTKLIIKEYANKVSQENYTAPIEFVITDAQNKAIGFKDFSSLLGLKFSPALMALLGDNFNLYIYNDITAPKIGIAIESRDDINLTKVMLSEEKNLADEISPIFFTSEYRTEKTFANSEYGGAKVRYQNIVSPDMLSVDYAVYKNKLLIGTTKLTLRSIVDKLNAVKNELAPETITKTEPAPPTPGKTVNN